MKYLEICMQCVRRHSVRQKWQFELVLFLTHRTVHLRNCTHGTCLRVAEVYQRCFEVNEPGAIARHMNFLCVFSWRLKIPLFTSVVVIRLFAHRIFKIMNFCYRHNVRYVGADCNLSQEVERSRGKNKLSQLDI